MIKVYQELENDCFQACIASILGCNIENIPNCYDNGIENFKNKWYEWEKDKPFHLIDMDLNKDTMGWMKDIVMIAVGKSPRGDYNHCVIMKNNKIIHDPHPDNEGIIGKPLFYTLVFPKNPSKPFCPICLEEMVMSRIECVDSSGYMFGWLCDCNEKLRGKINKKEKS